MKSDLVTLAVLAALGVAAIAGYGLAWRRAWLPPLSFIVLMALCVVSVLLAFGTGDWWWLLVTAACFAVLASRD